MVCYFKRICGINQAEDRVTWPDLLHRHTIALASFREWSVVSAGLRIRAQPRNPCRARNSASAWTWLWSSHDQSPWKIFNLYLYLMNSRKNPGMWVTGAGGEYMRMRLTFTQSSFEGFQGGSVYQVEDVTEILIRHNVWDRGPKFWTAT